MENRRLLVSANAHLLPLFSTLVLLTVGVLFSSMIHSRRLSWVLGIHYLQLVCLIFCSGEGIRSACNREKKWSFTDFRHNGRAPEVISSTAVRATGGSGNLKTKQKRKPEMPYGSTAARSQRNGGPSAMASCRHVCECGSATALPGLYVQLLMVTLGGCVCRMYDMYFFRRQTSRG